jgi:Flp pilus assembly protein TadG
MHNLIRDRRGVTAFATLIALTPLIGVVAVGAEAGSWYVTKQVAQNAADAAAYSGALRLACTIAGTGTCDTQAVAYRGKEFAAQNAFCNAGDTSYPGSKCATSLPKNVSQSVAIDIGDYSGGVFTTPPASTGNAVRAKVSQKQPAYLSAILGLTSITVGGHAIAQVQNPNPICGLGLSTSSSTSQAGLDLGGNLTLAGNGCGLQSDGVVKFDSSITAGSGWAAYGVDGCSPSSTCSSPGIAYDYFMPYVPNPLSGLNTASFNSTSGTTNACGNCTLPPGAYKKLIVNGSNVLHLQPGVYFFTGDVNITGGTIDCTGCGCTSNPAATSGTSGVNIVILGSAKLTINNASVKLCAGTNNAGSYSALNGVLIDDQASGAVSVGGNAGAGNPVELDGAVYAPNASITWSGTSAFASNTCAEVIGYTLKMTGSAYLSQTNCAPGTKFQTQVVVLVQ